MAKEWDDLTEKEQLLCYISDCFKDAYGCRPRGIYNDYSVEELRSTLDRLVEDANTQYEEEQKWKADNWKEVHVEFSNLVNIGAKDFKQALAWDMEAQGADGDFEYYCFLKRVDYSKAKIFQRLAA